MKNRQLLAFLTATALLLLLLTGCGGKTGIPGGTVVPNTTQATTEATTAPTSATTVTGDLGRMEGGVYTNTYTGYSVALNENWTYYTAQELQQLPENAKELFSDSELADQYNAIADMMAESVADLATINVQYQKLSMSERLAYATMSNDAFIDNLLLQKDVMVDAYISAGMTNIHMEKATATFLGESRTVLKTTFTNPTGTLCYVVQIQHYNLGAYGVTLTVTTFIEDNTQALLDLFVKA